MSASRFAGEIPKTHADMRFLRICLTAAYRSEFFSSRNLLIDFWGKPSPQR